MHGGVRWEAPSASPGAADTLVSIQDRSQSVCAARCSCRLPFKAPRSVALSLSLPLLTHSCELCVALFTSCVCDLLVCLWHSCVLLALWQRNSVVWTLQVFPVSQLLGVSKACHYYVGAVEFLNPSQGQPGLSLTLVMVITVIVIIVSLIFASLLIR